MAAIRGILVKRFGGPEVLKFVTNIPRPSKPTAKQLLVQVKSAGVNPVDTYIRAGSHVLTPALPYTPGVDGAGIVEEIGEQVTNFKVGDHVYWCRSVEGSSKELTLTEEARTFPLHSALTFQQGAALGVPYFSAYRSLVTKARTKAGETVLVHGASGAVGIACCQMAKALGAKVIGTAGTEEGMQLVLQNGADKVLNHTQPGYTDELKADGGVDIIMEMLANVNLEKDLEICALNGRIVIIGCRGKSEISPRFAMVNEVSIYGLLIFNATVNEWAEMGTSLTKGQEEGWLRPVVGLEFPLEHCKDAHIEVIAHKTATKGKIVLNV